MPQLLLALALAAQGEVLILGVDDAGVPVASGVYYYRLKAGEITSTRKMLLVK